MIDFRDLTSLHITNADVAAVVDEVLIKVIPLVNVILASVILVLYSII